MRKIVLIFVDGDRCELRYWVGMIRVWTRRSVEWFGLKGQNARELLMSRKVYCARFI